MPAHATAALGGAQTEVETTVCVHESGRTLLLWRRLDRGATVTDVAASSHLTDLSAVPTQLSGRAETALRPSADR